MTNITSGVLHGLTEEHLTDITINERTYKLTLETAAAFLEMRRAALSDGINLSIASSFRDFARQKMIFENKMTGKRPVLDRNERPIDISGMDPKDLIRAILFFSAVPGLSRHHWGTDIDVYNPDTVPEGEELDLTNICYTAGNQRTTAEWLTANMHRFGFFRPYSQAGSLFSHELWHISYYPEANLFTEKLNPEESMNFLKQAGILHADDVISVIKNEFTERFKLLPE